MSSNSGSKRRDTAFAGYSHGEETADVVAAAVGRWRFPRWVWACVLGGTLLANPAAAMSQPRSETARSLMAISGLVTDQTGAIVRGASVELVRVSDGAVVSTSVSGLYGMYRLEAGEGVYRVVVRASGFAEFESSQVQIAGSRRPTAAKKEGSLQVDAELKIATHVEQVEVPSGLSDPTRSGRDIVLSARDVQQMPLDPVALMDELTGLAGSSSAQVLVDGFSGGKMPSRSQIREIRINQNPYSAENDTDTVTAVIQVLTQPGTSKSHGTFYLYGDDSALNAANPFAPEQPPYYADGLGGELSGSVSKRANGYAGVDLMQQKTNAAVDALVLDSGFGTSSAMYTVPNPRTTLDGAARTDVKVSGNGILIVRYSLHEVRQSAEGVGQLGLLSQGLDERTLVHTLQAGNTLVLGPKFVDETRLQYIRTRTEQTPTSTAPTIMVQGAFTGGGNPQGLRQDHQDKAELQDYLSLAVQRHYVSLGGRLRVARDASLSQDHFNGEFVFANLDTYRETLAGMASGRSAAQIAMSGGGATQYVIGTGSQSAVVTVVDGAVFAQDEWRVRQNLKLSYGLRFETQNIISDHADWAPRAGFSWGLGASGKPGASGPRYIVHGGAGVFYRRFGTDTALNVSRFNGTSQMEYVVSSPQFCPPRVTTGSNLIFQGCAGAPSPTVLRTLGGMTVYRVSAGYRAPYFIEGSLGVDRQLGRLGTVGVTYLETHGIHTQFTENANAPLPGTYSVTNPAGGTRPEGNGLNVFQYESEGISRTRQLSTNMSVRDGRFTLIGHYILQFSNGDAESSGNFPLNRFDLGADYGRSLADIRHTGTVSGSVELPHGFSSWAYLQAASGSPFNIVVGDDLNGDTQYNDRPAFATDLTRPSVVRTQFGAFDTRPIAGQKIIPRNYGVGPGSITLNMAAGKRVGFGAQSAATGGAAKNEPKYTVELWVMALNLLNHPNLTQPVSVLGTPLFGQSVGVKSLGSLSPSRALDMQLSVRF